MEPAFNEFLFSGKPLGRGLRSLSHPGHRLVTLKHQHPEQTADFRYWSMWPIGSCHTSLLKGKWNERHAPYLKVFSPCGGVGGDQLYELRDTEENLKMSLEVSSIHKGQFPGKKMCVWGGGPTYNRLHHCPALPTQNTSLQSYNRRHPEDEALDWTNSPIWSWWEGSAVENIHCSCRRPNGSQPSSGSSQLPGTPVPSDRLPHSSGHRQPPSHN